MDEVDFKQLVARLEGESEAAPASYRAKVAGLAFLGFGILGLLLVAIGAGIIG
jgi:hypothetical protein